MMTSHNDVFPTVQVREIVCQGCGKTGRIGHWGLCVCLASAWEDKLRIRLFVQSDLFTGFFSSKDIQRNIMYFKGCVKDCLFGNQITGWLVPLRHQKFLKLSVKLSVPYLVLALSAFVILWHLCQALLSCSLAGKKCYNCRCQKKS